jgi:PAS domain-containing protein
VEKWGTHVGRNDSRSTILHNRVEVNTQQEPTSEQGPGTAGFVERLDALRARLAELRAQDPQSADLEVAGPGPEDSSLEMLAGLDTAYEELRVADEEVRTQQDHIGRLLHSHRLLHWQHERMLAMLPVPALMTDSDGTIRSVNAAAAALVVRRATRLLGKPIFTLFEPSDWADLRQLLWTGQSRVNRLVTSVVPQEGDPVKVELWVTLRSGETLEATWLLLTPGSPVAHHEVEALPGALSELAGLAAELRDVQDVLHHAAGICRRTLGGAEVSIQIGSPGGPEAMASTSRLPQAVDGSQLAAGEGPAFTAFADRSAVTSPDLRVDDRWPRLAEQLPEGPVSVVSAPVEMGQHVVGTLNVYGERLPLEVWVKEAAELLAATLGAVFHELELNAELDRLGEDMQRALSSRAVIEQAKGIIMAQKGCGPDEAFALLSELSSRQERKLRDVARDIVGRASVS